MLISADGLSCPDQIIFGRRVSPLSILKRLSERRYRRCYGIFNTIFSSSNHSSQSLNLLTGFSRLPPPLMPQSRSIKRNHTKQIPLFKFFSVWLYHFIFNMSKCPPISEIIAWRDWLFHENDLTLGAYWGKLATGIDNQIVFLMKR